MKNSVSVFIILLLAVVAVSCISHKESLLQYDRAMQYWESLPDCCVGEIRNDLFYGIILDGSMLCQVDKWFSPYIKSIIKTEFDSSQAFNFILKDSIVIAYERQCADSSYLSDSPRFVALKEKPYCRQYVGMILDGCPYLFVSFDRLDPQCEYSVKQREQCYQTFRLIYSRCFIAPGMDFHPNENMRFWMLYNIANKQIFTYP